VVFPLPDGPTIAQALPSSIAKETSLRTASVWSPLLKSLLKCSTLKMIESVMLH
jgi:hypothetical protein